MGNNGSFRLGQLKLEKFGVSRQWLLEYNGERPVCSDCNKELDKVYYCKPLVKLFCADCDDANQSNSGSCVNYAGRFVFGHEHFRVFLREEKDSAAD